MAVQSVMTQMSDEAQTGFVILFDSSNSIFIIKSRLSFTSVPSNPLELASVSLKLEICQFFLTKIDVQSVCSIGDDRHSLEQ